MNARDNFPADDLDSIINSPVRATPVKAPENYKPKSFTDPCPKCRGTGRFSRGSFSGQCFTCKGKGTIAYAQPADVRAKARQQSVARRVKSEADNLAAFAKAHPEIAAWYEGNDFRFAIAMRDAVIRYGSLTDAQQAAAQKCIDADKARNEERVAKRVAAEAAAPTVDTAGVDRLKESFDKAIAFVAAKGNGLRLKNPRITIGNLTISPAKATSTNPGALYVKAGGEYLGKITNGKFYAVAACTDAQREEILKFIADPAQAAKTYGQTTGVCCVCNATLTSKWKLKGIGPICAEKYGW